MIVLKSVGKLKTVGNVVDVKDGYARNFLIPKGFALQATKDNFSKLEEIKKKEEKAIAKAKEVYVAMKEKIEGISLTITSEVKEDDEIYGSINEVNIIKQLKEEGIDLEKESLQLQEPIKKIGVYNIKVNLHPEVDANLRVWIVKK